MNRSDCVTDAAEQVAGIRVVTDRILNELPSSILNKYFNSTEIAFYQEMNEIAPNIPLMIASDNKTQIVSPGARLPPKNGNTENSELYTVHPFRIYQWFKPNLTLALNTYNHRRFRCNKGWCQDILDSAMLGLTGEASSMLIDRAYSRQDGFNWKWDGFSGRFQDYQPSLDHLSWSRTAIHYMLIQNNFKTHEIYLLPTWPCEWNVKFKFYAINQTIVELEYNGISSTSGNVVSLSVIPKEREKDVVFVNCVS